jgi:solute carrier family 25 phosphate transporter 23/24/25/41
MIMQVKTPEYEGMNMARSFAFMWQREGLYGLMKGNGINVVRIAPFSAFEFFFYSLYKRKIFGGSDASPLKKLICGGMTGMTASFLTYPLDLIRTIMSVKVDGRSDIKPSILGTGRDVLQKEGIQGLYKGLPATLYVTTITV